MKANPFIVKSYETIIGEIDSFSPIRYPRQYTSKNGQLLEHSPFCERDIRPPSELKTFDQTGDFLALRDYR
jgi:hypothetical protein